METSASFEARSAPSPYPAANPFNHLQTASRSGWIHCAPFCAPSPGETMQCDAELIDPISRTGIARDLMTGVPSPS